MVRSDPVRASRSQPINRNAAQGMAVVLLLALALAGCSSDWMGNRERASEMYLTAPVSYRADILAFMHTYLNNPSGVRDAFISEPTRRTLENIDRYVVCLRYNARKSNGQYAGSKDSMVLFREGRFDRIVDSAKEQCKDAAYQPFPELERLAP